MIPRQVVQPQEFQIDYLNKDQGYSLDYNGDIASRIPEQNGKKTKELGRFIGLSNGDTIHLIYNKSENKLTFKNITKEK